MPGKDPAVSVAGWASAGVAWRINELAEFSGMLGKDSAVSVAVGVAFVAGGSGAGDSRGGASDPVRLEWLDMAGELASPLGEGDGREVAWLLYANERLMCVWEGRTRAGWRLHAHSLAFPLTGLWHERPSSQQL